MHGVQMGEQKEASGALAPTPDPDIPDGGLREAFDLGPSSLHLLGDGLAERVDGVFLCRGGFKLDETPEHLEDGRKPGLKVTNGNRGHSVSFSVTGLNRPCGSSCARG
jgi:hypothetical protein